jgi:hypothetical protein
MNRPPRIRSVVVNGLLAIACWVVVAVKGSDIAYFVAVAFTYGLVADAGSRWAHATGLPEWRPNEAYLVSLRRWHRSRSRSA